MIALIIAVTTLLLWFILGAEWFFGMRSMTTLKVGGDVAGAELPRVSVIIPALNEAEAIEESLKSVLNLDYPDYEVIAINDRSTDATDEILERMRAEYPQLKVIHIETLPEGWLGKNHALYTGAKEAKGDWLLFTDADIKHHPRALKRTVRYALEHNRDYLTALPYMEAKGVLLNAFVSTFALLFSVYAQPWRAKKPRSKAHIGVGAFILVKRKAYEAAGTHEAIRLRPDDDMQLGRLLKTAGYSQEAVFGHRLLSVEWYTSLPQALRGLNKNAFAGLGYSLPLVIIFMGLLFITNVYPFIAVFFTRGLVQLCYALVILIVLAIHAYNARYSKLSFWYGLLYPVGTSLLIYAALASTYKALTTGGIEWRGTRYALETLRKG